MSKYYVECGCVQVVLTAESAEQAALACLDRVLQMHLWIYDDPCLTERDCREHLMLEALLHLDPSVRVNERGFGRNDSVLIGTPETVEQWHRLIASMNRLFVAAGLPPRSRMFGESPHGDTAAVQRRHPR